jgi:hypothetical protein
MQQVRQEIYSQAGTTACPGSSGPGRKCKGDAYRRLAVTLANAGRGAVWPRRGRPATAAHYEI